MREPRQTNGHGVQKQPARLSSRALAAGLDLVVVAVAVLLVFPKSLVDQLSGLVALAVAAAVFCYHTALESLFGATLGKFVMGLRVVGARAATKPPVDTVVFRNLPRLVDVVLAYLPGALSARASATNRTIGDRLADTLVVSRPESAAVRKARSVLDRSRREEEESRRRRERAGQIGEEIVARELAHLSRLDGAYYVWNDVEEPTVGNIDHLVVGPGGLTIVETKAHRGLVSVQGSDTPTVDGRPLERDVMRQVDFQRRAVLERMGLGDVDPEKIVGFEWLICFPRGRLDPAVQKDMRHRLATARDLRSRIRCQATTATPQQVLDMAGAITHLYARRPDFSPPDRTGGEQGQDEERGPLAP